MKKILLLLVAAALGGYWLLLSKPGLYFGNSLEHGNFTLRAHAAIPGGAQAVLDKAAPRLAASELFKPDSKFEIYAPATRKEFVFFTLLQSGDYYRVNPYTGAIFLAAADFPADRARLEPGDREYHLLSDELVKAAARELSRRTIPVLTYMLTDEWKLRGYGERLAAVTGDFVPADICSSEKPEDAAFQNYKYAIAVDFALKEGPYSFGELLNKDLSYESVLGRYKKTYCPK